MSQSSREGVIAIHAAALILSFTGYFASTIQLPALDIIFWRCLFAATVIFLLLHRPSRWLAINGQWRWLLMAGVLTGVHWLTYFQAMQWAGWGMGTLALFTFPVMTAILEPLLRRQGRIGRFDLGLVLLAFMGVLLLVPWHQGLQDEQAKRVLMGLALGLLSALCWSCRNIWARQHLSGINSFTSMGWQMWIAMLMLAPFVSQSPASIAWQDWGLLLLLAAVITALPHSLILAALSRLPATTISMISCIQPAYAITWGWLILGQQLSLMSLAGALLIVMAALLESRRRF